VLFFIALFFVNRFVPLIGAHAWEPRDDE
jgi:hypothetical protein